MYHIFSLKHLKDLSSFLNNGILKWPQSTVFLLLIVYWFVYLCCSDGSWWAQCLTAVLELESLSVRLTSARSEMSDKAPATWSTACELHSTHYQATDCQATVTSDNCTKSGKFHPMFSFFSEILMTWSAHLTNLKSSVTKRHFEDICDSCRCSVQSLMLYFVLYFSLFPCFDWFLTV